MKNSNLFCFFHELKGGSQGSQNVGNWCSVEDLISPTLLREYYFSGNPASALSQLSLSSNLLTFRRTQLRALKAALASIMCLSSEPLVSSDIAKYLHAALG